MDRDDLRLLPPMQVNIREAARLLSFHEATVRRMILRGELPSIGKGRLRRVAVKDIERWIERNRRGAA